MPICRRPKQYRQYITNCDVPVPSRTLRYWRQKERQRLAAMNNAQAAVINELAAAAPAEVEHEEYDADLLLDDTLPVEDVDNNDNDSEHPSSELPPDGTSSDNESSENQTTWDPQFDVERHLALGVNAQECDEGIGSFEGEDDNNRGNLINNSAALSARALDAPLFYNAKVTKYETLLMVFNLVLRHGMTGAFLEDMMKFVNTIAGDDNAIPSSKYYFNKLFSVNKEIDIHFYCPVCNIYLGHKSSFSEDVECRRCMSVASSSSFNNGSFFVTLGIKDQLETLLSRSDVKLTYPATDRPAGVISDIYDGKLYKSLVRHCQAMGKKEPLTVTINTDGSPVFKCSKNSLWPIQFTLNELHPSVRFRPENVFLAGLWFGKTPIVDAYLKPVVDELNTLSTHGITIQHAGETIYEVPVFGICCVTDSAARPKVQKHHMFNGAFGCGYCLHPGIATVINEEGNSQLRYIFDDVYPYRTDDGLRIDMEKASSLPRAHGQGGHSNGSLGLSPLCSLNMFDVVFGFGIDYMHAVLEGTIKRLCDLWFTPNRLTPKAPYYLVPKINQVDRRMKNISPPSWLRQARPLSLRKSYKASDWLAFLLFYAMPSLVGILPEPYYSHAKKLVMATYCLLKDSMTYAETEAANELLHDFVAQFANLYGEKHMVYNIHIMLHLGKAVSMLGPLWASSAFCFESGNGRLVKLVRGTTGVATQIARKYLMANNSEEIIRSGYYKISPHVLDVCEDLVCYKRAQNSTKVGDVTCLGTPGVLNLSNYNIDYQSTSTIFESYNRVVWKETLYHAKARSRQECFNDSCIKLDTGQYAILESVFVDRDDVLCLVRVIRLPRENDPRMPPHILRTTIDPFAEETVVPISTVQKKCILLHCDNIYYVSESPNNFERD